MNQPEGRWYREPVPTIRDQAEVQAAHIQGQATMEAARIGRRATITAALIGGVVALVAVYVGGGHAIEAARIGASPPAADRTPANPTKQAPSSPPAKMEQKIPFIEWNAYRIYEVDMRRYGYSDGFVTIQEGNDILSIHEDYW